MGLRQEKAPTGPGLCREFITLLGGAAAAWPLSARAQRIDQTMRRVGVLMPFAPDDPEARLRVAALEQGLRDLGWVNNRNVRIDYRWVTDDPRQRLCDP